jgi:uncharacterized membrane protein
MPSGSARATIQFFNRETSAVSDVGIRRSILQPADIRRLVVFAFTLLVIVPTFAWLAGGRDDWSTVSWRLGLDLDAWAAAPLSARIHAIAVVTLTIAGWCMLALPKGDRRHRTLGWSWVIAMVVMGVASMAVPHGDNWVAAYVGGGSAYVLLGFGIYSVRRRRLRTHGKTMAMLMIALVLMTMLAVIPGRLLHDVLFGG